MTNAPTPAAPGTAAAPPAPPAPAPAAAPPAPPPPPAAPPAPPARTPRRYQVIDRFLGSDPGLNRFRSALMSVLTIGVILEAELIFVRFTHALQIPTPVPAAQATQVALANHDYLVIMMLLGAILGMISGFGVMDPDARGQLITVLFLPVPMFPALALGIALGGQRVLSLVLLAVILAAGTYLRRFGPRGMVAGMLLFMGFFFGFFLHGVITPGDLGWVAAALGVGDVVALAVRFTFFYPHQDKALQRTQRSYRARAHKVASLALQAFEDTGPGENKARRLARQLVRLNEAALMIDAQLGDSGELEHQRLFDVELALTNIARFAVALGGLDVPADQCAEVRLALNALAVGDLIAARQHAESLLTLLAAARPLTSEEDSTAVVVVHRFAGSILALSVAWPAWLAGATTEGERGTFEPAVVLFGGWLPGSAQVSAVASAERGTRRGDRIRLAPYTRAAIQVGVAVGVSILLGDVVSGRRFYWAVIAAFITFMGVNNSGEQARKGLYRIAGTVVGIGIGSLLATAVGHRPYWSIAVILISLFFGFYFMRINYAFMVIGITVMVSQLYVQLGEFSNSLLGLRLAETAIGSSVAIIVVTVVFPLRTRRVLRVALRAHVQAVRALVDHATSALLGELPGSASTLRADARAVDASHQALVATAQPLRRNLFGSHDEDTSQAMRMAAASRNYSRDLVNDAEGVGPLDPGLRADVTRASATLHSSLDILAESLTGPTQGDYTRSAALFDRTDRRLEERAERAGRAERAERAGGAWRVDDGEFAIRDLKLIDGAMAKLAELAGLPVTDFDTVGTARP